jgi:hypothetical protein
VRSAASYIAARERESERAVGGVGELPVISNKESCVVAVKTRTVEVQVALLATKRVIGIMETASCVRRRPLATCLLLITIVMAAFAATDGSSEKNSASETTSSSTTELKSEVLYKPEVCETKSKNGDMLTMHYKGTLQDGTAFDSR